MNDWRFLFATDIHIGSPRSFRFAPAWNQNWQVAKEQMIPLEPDFLLIGGDLARDGNIHAFEMEAVKAELDALPFPCHVIPGNMDTGNKRTDVSGPRRDDVSLNITSESLRNFRDTFGPLWWSFDHQGVRFSAFCDILVGSGLPEEEALWVWLDEQAAREPANRQVWMTHYPLFIEDPDEANWDIRDPEHYHDWYFSIDRPWRDRLLDVFRRTHTDLVLSGHVHCRKRHEFDGITFLIGPSTAFPQWGGRWPDGDATLGFMSLEVDEQLLRPRFVPLARVSHEKGYGPGGHPMPAERDYSLAWEKPPH